MSLEALTLEDRQGIVHVVYSFGDYASPLCEDHPMLCCQMNLRHDVPTCLLCIAEDVHR